VDLQIGVHAAGRYVVLISQIVQCARIVGECAANKTMSTHRSALLTLLGHGHALEMATWGKHKQCTCEVKHAAAVLRWAVDSYSNVIVLVQEKRAELVAAVHKAACDCANAVQSRATGSIGVIFTEVDVEVRRLRADLQITKEDLQLTHTELASVEAEANRFSLALTGVKQDLEREAWHGRCDEGPNCRALHYAFVEPGMADGR
jgi:hypothetical protein